MTHADDVLPTETPVRLLTEAEVADLLRCRPRTVRYIAERGELPRVRFGRRMTRYRPADVAALIESRADRLDTS